MRRLRPFVPDIPSAINRYTPSRLNLFVFN
jgi:hypothetical protein